MMSAEIIQLPRPAAVRPSPNRLGHYLHVDWSDHIEVLQLLAEGERGYSGFVVSAAGAERQKELLKEASKRGFDVILDPKSQQSALPGSFSASLSKLPWGLERPHVISDFSGDGGRTMAAQVAAFAADHGFSQAFAPTHVLRDGDDPWLDIDLAVSDAMRKSLRRDIQLIYPLTLPMAVFRDPRQVSSIAKKLNNLDVDAVWLRVENFGADASGEKAVSYVELARLLATLNVPVIADHAAGLPGLALLAFGAVGGLAHGVMAHEGFSASSWRRPKVEGQSGGLAPRVFVPALDMLLPKAKAEVLLGHSIAAKGHYGCQDPRCCPKGMRDTFQHPARHYLRQRAREVELVSAIPPSLRVSEFLEKKVRPTSDAVAAAAALKLPDNTLAVAIAKRQKVTSRMRLALSSLADRYTPPEFVILPKARDERKT